MHRWALLFAACGRLHFDPVAGGIGGDGGLAACTVTTEICDGIDNDCDGQIDESCPCTAFEVTVPTMTTGSEQRIVWTGTGYLALVWQSTLTLVALGAGGQIGGSTPVAPAGTLLSAWSGSRAAQITFVNGFQLELYDTTAARVAQQPIFDETTDADIAWAPRQLSSSSGPPTGPACVRCTCLRSRTEPKLCGTDRRK